MPVIAWMYPKTRNPTGVRIVSYAARIGMELGADMIKTYYTGSEAGFKKVVSAAQETPVLCSGGLKTGNKQFLTQVRSVMNAGAAGLAVGRNVWQHKQPLKMVKATRAVMFKNARVRDALKFLK
jgi:DhnA family fructose-bisphosphate aldolase class Ia